MRSAVFRGLIKPLFGSCDQDTTPVVLLAEIQVFLELHGFGVYSCLQKVAIAPDSHVVTYQRSKLTLVITKPFLRKRKLPSFKLIPTKSCSAEFRLMLSLFFIQDPSTFLMRTTWRPNPLCILFKKCNIRSPQKCKYLAILPRDVKSSLPRCRKTCLCSV